MGKQGPCCHCGATSTPLWRNGPPEKPVLCNACGSRWRTKGSLRNYLPNQLNGPVRSRSALKNDGTYLRRKKDVCNSDPDYETQLSDQNLYKASEWSTSFHPSSGSAISCSDSCTHISTSNASDVTVLTGSSQSDVWGSVVPSKKRTSRAELSSVDKLRKDLYSIMQEQYSSCLLGGTDGDLIYHSGTPMDSLETSYGSALIRQTNSEYIEDDTEASSVTLQTASRVVSKAFVESTTVPVLSSGVTKTEESENTAKRKRLNLEELFIQDKLSPLLSIDMEDICNYENFTALLTSREQEELLKYLSLIDIMDPPTSIRNLFASPQFAEVHTHYQMLLRDGVFDLSLPGVSTEECGSLEGCVLGNLAKSTWVECYEQLKMNRDKQAITGHSFEESSFDQIDHSRATQASIARTYTRTRRSRGIESAGFKGNYAPCSSQGNQTASPLGILLNAPDCSLNPSGE